MATGVNPVFLKSKDVPNVTSDRPVSVLEMCLAAERTAGQGSVIGAQLMNGLWRIYPASREARSTILVQGVRIRGTAQQTRGRSKARQTTLRSSLQLGSSPRRRSETPKRRRSGDTCSPETSGKQPRRDGRISDRPSPPVSDNEDDEVCD
ncbi:uncharacterized protein LOC143298339 [Babylonia areolata]|uniref:uncharacterized protein LOC143276198 n=1 Tax=Babylonia areolata TaxID=304850 RepID=UPI003FD6924F